MQLIDFFLYERYKNAFESLIKKNCQEENLNKNRFCIQMEVYIMIGLVWYGLVHSSFRLDLPSESNLTCEGSM